MRNESNRVNVSLSKVLSSRPFGRGFSAYRNGEPFEGEAYRRLNDQWAYERGRMFAAWYDGALRINRRLSPAAYRAAREALNGGALI
jgi:hypothetical protein